MKLRFFTNRQYREDKIVNWVSIGLLFFITSFIWMPKRDGLQVIFAIGFLLPMLCVLPFRKLEFNAYGGWLTYLALIFAAYSTVTSLWAPVSKPDFFVTQFLVLMVWLMGIAWFAGRREIEWKKLQEYLLWSGVVVGVANIVMFYNDNPWFARLESDFAAKNPNEVGALFGILTLLAFCQWLRAASSSQAIYYGIIAIVLFVPLLASQSRGALAALVLTSFIAIFYNRPSRSKLILLLVAGLGTIGLFCYSLLFTNGVVDRLSTGLRDSIWQEIFTRSVNEHLWFGIGMEKFQKIIIPDVDVFDHAHNVWLDTFYHTGLIGLLLALAHVFYVLQKFKPTPARIPLYLWLMFSLVASMFDYRTFFWQIDFKWFLFWIPIGLIVAVHIQESKQKINQGSV